MIDQDQFCSLAASDKFRLWLKNTDPDLHAGLIEHLRKGLGCKSNKEKMKSIFDKIKRDDEKLVELNEWIKDVYPSLLVYDPKKPLRLRANNEDIHGVFPDYDPTLPTIPRRVIITVHDAVRNEMDLRGLIGAFCTKQAYCDYFTTGDRAYIEYLPKELAGYVNKIPDANLMLPRFRRQLLDRQK
jgi:hypothetical protein